MAGYAIECIIKARLMTCFDALTLDQLQSKLRTRLADPELKLRVHSLDQLGALYPRWKEICQDARFKRCWAAVRSWSVTWRYEREVQDELVAKRFLESVREVLQCIQRRF